ncbi:MAG: hypothetical protein R3B36_15075 [Polyangiaceae bacterium]
MKRLVALALVAVAAAGCSVPGGPGRGAPFSKSKQERDRRGEEEPRRSPRSVQLFDVRRAERAVELEVGPVWYRKAEPTREGYERGTGELLLGVATTSRWKPFYLSGVQSTHLRVFGSKEASWSLLASQLGAGIRWGPLEPEVRLGIGLLTADVFNGDYSVQLLTPRVGVGAGLKLGKFKLDIKAHTEYLWRWFGEDYIVRGVSLGLRLDDTPPPKFRRGLDTE